MAEGLGSGMKTGISTAILIILLSSVFPDVFTNLVGFDNSTTTPAWLYTVAKVLVAAVFVFLIWRQVE